MKTFLQYLDEQQELLVESNIIEAFLDEMSNLTSSDTGLDYVIWVGEVGGQHGPRVKVSNTRGRMNKDSCFVMSVAKEPQLITPKSCRLKSSEVDEISDWIKLNYGILMKMWKVYETGNGSLISLQNQLLKL